MTECANIHHARRQPAFTIIELLVVITIIALLISILLPALTAARNNAQKAACLSNQRQIGIGFGVYVSESDDWWPNASGAGTGPLRTPPWSRIIAKTLRVTYVTEQGQNAIHQPYAPEQQPAEADTNGDGIVHSNELFPFVKTNNGIFRCPSDNYVNSSGGTHSTSYSGNESALGRSSLDVTLTPTRHFPQPSKTMIVGEGSWVQHEPASNNFFDWGTNFQFKTANFLGGFLNPSPPHLFAGVIHQGTGNYLFADGHAVTLQPMQLLPENIKRDPNDFP